MDCIYTETLIDIGLCVCCFLFFFGNLIFSFMYIYINVHIIHFVYYVSNIIQLILILLMMADNSIKYIAWAKSSKSLLISMNRTPV